jgi:predicted Zn-dependent protease
MKLDSLRTHRRPSARLALPSRRAAWLLSSLGGLLVLAAGCKSMTEAKLDKLLKEAEERQLKLDQQDQTLRENAERLNIDAKSRNDRQDKLRIAEEKLIAGDPKAALSAVEELLAPVQRTIKDPATGKEQTAKEETEELPPGMDSSEQALLLAFRGNVLVELERPVDAEASYREALKANSSNRTARRNLGRLLFNAKKYPAALETWLPELADGRRDAELLSMVGRARYEVAKADQNPAELQSARVALEQVLIEKPDDVDTIKILADIAFEAGRHAEARTYYDLVRRRTPLDGVALVKLGYCALSLGDKRQALDYLELAAGSKLASKELCSTLSTLCLEHNLPSRAADWLVQSYKNEPASAPPEAKVQVASLLVAAWRGEEALPWLAVAPSDPNYEEAQALLVKIHAAAGRSDEAVAAYEKIKKAAALDGTIHLTAGSMYLERKTYDLAIACFSKASGTPKLKADGLRGLAEVALEKGDLTTALKYSREAVAARPNDAALASALARLEDEISLSASAPPLSAASPQRTAR